jgi:hypothetical protein
MKSDALEVSTSNVEVSTQPVNTPTDFPTILFEHPQMRAIAPKGLTNKEKAIALTAAELKDEFLHERKSRSAPERMFRLAFLQRLFSNQQTLALPSSGTPPETPKSFWSSWSLSAFVPIAGAILIAFAAWRTGETSSWKGVADANKAHVETLKDQLAQAQSDKKDLQHKNDALQDDLNDTLKNAADQKSDVATLTQKLGELLKKYKGSAPPKDATAAPQPSAQGGTQ